MNNPTRRMIRPSEVVGAGKRKEKENRVSEAPAEDDKLSTDEEQPF